MESPLRILCTGVVLITLISEASTVRCYYCNSANNSACLDTGRYDAELRARILPVVNCATAVPGMETTPLFCRKIEQIIYHKDRDSELRVTRGCGWVADSRESPCYRVNSPGHYDTVCQCFTDYCNAAGNVRSYALVVSMVVILLRLFRF